MKTILLLLLSFNLSAQEVCTSNCEVVEQDVNTPTPEELKDAEIVIKTKKGNIHKMSANSFKVVKRQQQFKVKETIVTKTEYVSIDKTNKHLLFLSAGYGIVDAKSDVEDNVARAYIKKGPIVGVNYIQNQVFNRNLSLGLGVESNSTLKGYLGFFLD